MKPSLETAARKQPASATALAVALPRALRAAGGTFPAARGEFEGIPSLSTA